MRITSVSILSTQIFDTDNRQSVLSHIFHPVLAGNIHSSDTVDTEALLDNNGLSITLPSDTNGKVH
jgi:hypothetical protein